MNPLLTALLFAHSAHAVPAQFTHQGRLLDADESPLDGEADLTFRIINAESGGDILWEETVTVSLTHGFYSAVLGADMDENPLDTGTLSQAPVWLEVQVDDEAAMVPRSAINSVPYASMATVAEEVSGGPVDATQIAIDGDLVINESGEWVGPAATVSWSDIADIPADFADGVDDDTDTDMDSLADLALSCEDGDIPVWDSVLDAWSCDFDQDTLAMIGCTDGQLIRWSSDASGWMCSEDADTQLSESEVDEMVSNNGYALTDDVFSGSFSDLSGVPAGLEDGDDDTTLSETEVDEMVSNNGYALTADVFSGSFSDLTDVPEGIGVDTDTLADLDCETGQFVVKTDSGWSCTDPYAAFDADGDGVFAWQDCDDTDPTSTTMAVDGDCDGVPTSEDCDDADPSSSDDLGSTSGCPASSCAAIKIARPDATSGYFWVDPTTTVSVDPFEVYCDLETDGGGWTLAVVINSSNSDHIDINAVGTIGYPEDLSTAKLSDYQINLLSGSDGLPGDSVYRFTCNEQTDYLRYEMGWNSTALNGDADFTYRYVCDTYSPCVPDRNWSYYDGGTSTSDRGGGSYPQFDALQFQADGQNGCYHGGYYRNGLLWVR